jgi:hypothetical protein
MIILEVHQKDTEYTQPPLKHTVSMQNVVFTEYQVFK